MSKLGELKKGTPSLAEELTKLGLSPAEQQELEEEMAEKLKKAMKLTADEIKWARELGDTPEEYAAAKREIMLVTEAMTRKDPEFAVILQPLLCVAQRTRLDPTVVLASFDFTPQQSCAFQHHHMLGDCVEGNREGFGDFIDRSWMARQCPQNGASCRVGQRGKYPIQFLGSHIFNHAVEYYTASLSSVKPSVVKRLLRHKTAISPDMRPRSTL